MDIFTLAFFGKLAFILLVYYILFRAVGVMRQESSRYVAPSNVIDVGLGRLEFIQVEDRNENGFIPGDSFPLDEEKIVIGAYPYPESNLPIDDDSVSGKHAILSYNGSQWEIEDIGTYGAGSTQGTFINNIQIPACRPQIVPWGVAVRLGNVVFKLVH